MPLTMDLDSSNTKPSVARKNDNDVLAITTSNDTITINVNSNWPRVIVLRPTTDASVTTRGSGATKFPITSGGALHLELSETTIFQVSADSAGGNMHVLVVR